jgi:hypothetical protein
LLQEITPSQITEINKGSFDTISLFYQKKVFITGNLDKYLKQVVKRASKDNIFLKILSNLAASKTNILINWEEGKSTWDLKNKTIGQIKEFKLKDNIFQLLDNCYPDNKENFLRILNSISQTEDEIFIFTMLIHHIRNLILAYEDGLPAIPAWKRHKLIYQAKKWPLEKLIIFYSSLYKIEKSIKTNHQPLSFKRSLDILVCYSL